MGLQDGLTNQKSNPMKKYLSLLFLLFLFAPLAHANDSIFPLVVKTQIATTTLDYLTPGTATTTLTYDSYKAGLTKTDALALLTQFTASTTGATLLINEEFSQDGVDWYQSTQPNVFGNSTTTLPVSLTPVPQYSWTFASSTPGLGAVSSSNNLDSRILMVTSPLRFIRFIFTMKIGGTNGAIWSEIVPAKQAPN